MRPVVVLLLMLALLADSMMAVSGKGGSLEADLSGELMEVAANDFTSRLKYSYEEIDRHALNAPASAGASIESLAAYLAEPAKNDREMARAIFRWIAENIDYNMEAFFKGGGGAAGAEEVLKSGKSVCYGYSDLFLSLAGEAGLEAARISGYGKGYGYQPGKNFSGPSNHAWNAVKINGSWYLVDSTWAAGYVNGEGKYVRKFDDHFFMTPPTQFIYDHFPEEDCWQLLDEPVSKEKFENMVYLQSDFFSLGLKLAGRENGTISADGQVNISIYAPDDMLMMAGLEYADGGAAGRAGLDGYTFCQRDGDRYDIYAQFPVSGSYILKAYAKKKNDTGKYDSVLEYRINAVSGEESAGFPMTYGKFTEAGAYLFSPMQGRLKAGESYWFRIRAPGAQEVAVVSGEEWSHLASRGDLFEGNATARKGDVGVYANFGGEEWEGMVGYSLY
jgi:hypothetical protein